ncbi:MAG: hypothetical protein JSW11_12020 [Candidatus Heimdallarchaeota archaeon]|nr:MAG: hypothetical protein JSW11_12020 [Candidatus Heimdallarchaeota archaeon]
MHSSIRFQISDKNYRKRAFVNLLVLIGWLLLGADLVPILGLFSTAFLSMAITLIGFLTYKSKRWNARINKRIEWIIIIFLSLGLILFILYLENKVDFLLIIARPFNLLQPVPAIPFTEKFGYLTGYTIFQTITIVIFLALLSQRRKIVWTVDLSNQILHLVLYHPFYDENRIIHFKNVQEAEFGASSPFKRLFTNTQEITLTRLDSRKEKHELSLVETPIFLLMDQLISIFEVLLPKEEISIRWFRELGDSLQNGLLTRYKITEHITLPIPLSQRFFMGKKFLTKMTSTSQPVIKEVAHPKRGALYRLRLGDIFLFLIGICCLPVAIILGSFLIDLRIKSISFPEFGFTHGFNGEILLIGSLFLIVIITGFRLVFLHSVRLFGQTTLQWTENALLISTQWRFLKIIDHIIPYSLIWDIYPILESLTTGLSKIWVQTPFIRLPIWSEITPNDPEINKIVFNTVYHVEKELKSTHQK